MEYKFTINEFEGPLDLLLHLIKETKMDICEIKTTEIIDQYIKYIHAMEKLNIDIASEYLVMTSELLHLKSKIILNITEPEDDENTYEINTEDELKKRLLEYEKIKLLTNDFKILEDRRSEVYTKVPENLMEYADATINLENTMSLNDLLGAFLSYVDKQALIAPLETKITNKEYSVHDRTNYIRSLLKTKKSLKFQELFDILTKDYVIVTLLSILEMSKNNEIAIRQNNNFEDIMIEAK